MNSRTIFSISLFALMALMSWGQSMPLDSLYAKAKRNYAGNHLDAAILLCEAGIQAAQKERLVKPFAEFVFMLGEIYEAQEEADSGQKYYAMAFESYLGLGLKKEATLARVGMLEITRRVDPSTAMAAYADLLKEARQSKNMESYYLVLEDVMSIDYGMGNLEEAISKGRELRAHFTAIHEMNEVAKIDQALGNFYFDNQPDSARSNYERAIATFERGTNMRSLVQTLQSCGGLLRDADPKTSWKYLLRADSIDKAYGIHSPQLPLLIARSLLKDGHPDRAIVKAKESYNLSLRAKKLFITIQASEVLSKIYLQVGNGDSAYHYLETVVAIKDSIRSNKQHEEVGKLEAKLEYEKEFYQKDLKDRELALEHIAEIERQDLVIIASFVVAGMLLLVIASILVAYIRDRRKSKVIAKQKADLEALNAINKRIFSVISHDFKGPLLSMRLLLDALESKRASAEKIDFYTSDIRSQLIQSELVLQNLLHWAKTELGLGRVLIGEHSALQPVIDQVTRELQQQAQAKGIQILNLIPDHFSVAASSEILTIVYRNLIANAIKFSPMKGKVECGIDLDHSTLFVRDYGVGIPIEKQANLFSGNTETTLGTQHEIGFGLGLYITHEMIKKSGGKLWVESVQGKTTFFFTLKLS